MHHRMVWDELKSSWGSVWSISETFDFSLKYPVVSYPVESVGGINCQCDDDQKSGEDAKTERGLVFHADSDFLLHFSYAG